MTAFSRVVIIKTMEKKNQPKKNKMTLGKLAGMVQRGFVDLEDRLGGRIDGVENRLNGVEARLDGVETRLDNVVMDIADMKKEIINKLDQKVDKVQFVKLEKRVSVLEKVAVKQKKN
ncbi:MAG: hypothetical protein A2359_02060 [Candidatus Moranbacteria bacterium RIFOXYB1_FULL_43_19]|nr:MAG: hypothetical protein A2359_02060 [Candidatus Moranbacteria bacterium RIFOXYB1_FULL_43_19]OGI34167.1 MAG: hypothetical protein A2420_02165 [Candidatus Moranbacteria bacterium RIFOXYC1_FULL_44_13]OGI38352.1 MAG: hypothetical protein A2612_01940 [Candidatus Moranbacteria bacterium RIFOXYD1_FULL_44_12]